MTKSYCRKWMYHGCIIRQRAASYQVEINHGGARKRYTRPTLAEAKTLAEQEAVRIKNEGTMAFNLTLAHRLDAAKAVALLPKGVGLETVVKNYNEAVARLDGAPLDNAVDFYLRHHNPSGGVRTVTALLAEYLAAKRKENCRPRSLLDINSRIGLLSKDLGARPVHAITSAEIEAWLDGHNYTGQTRINFLRVFTSFFNFAKAKHLLDFNPASKDAIPRPRLDEHLPAIFTVRDVERLLQAASTYASAVVPYLALGFFAGIRTAELSELNWTDVDFESKLVTVRPAVAKKRRQRHVTLSDNLIAWLAPLAKSSGTICPPLPILRKGLAIAVKKSKVRWVHNGMRHTFASAHLVKYQNIAVTMLALGHAGDPNVLFNHYRNLLKPADAEVYWNIMPPQAGQVIQVPPGAFAHG